MLIPFVTDTKQKKTPIHLIPKDGFTEWLSDQPETFKNWCQQLQYKPEAGAALIIPGQTGEIDCVIAAVADEHNLWGAGNLPMLLPEGIYEIDSGTFKQFFKDEQKISCGIVWGLGAYQFTTYKKATRQAAQLFLNVEEHNEINLIVNAIYLVRDLINTPADDLGPTEFARLTEKFAEKHHAQFTEIVGEDLLKENYAAIYTVGRASDEPPRLLDIRWGNPDHPKVTLVGKGVCFDTGGLNLKSAQYMDLMRKDMAGAAHVLGLSQMIMQAELPIYLRVLMPVVENAVSGNAYRPGDIIKSRKGLTIEIGNTDAEGRVILADALTEAASESPQLLIDLASLTGAARIACGAEIAVMFANNNALARAVIEQGEKLLDPIWQLPLYAPYREALKTPFADINNCGNTSYGGAITAALFLKDFVPDHIPWLHFDMMAWNERPRPGHPVGGEAMALRALFGYLRDKYT